MVDTVAEPNEAFLAIALGIKALTDLVAAKIWTQIPAGQALGPMVTFSVGGGSADKYLPMRLSTVEARTWGASPEEARQVYRALADGLHGQQDVVTDAGAAVRYVFEDGAGVDSVDPATSWNFVQAKFMMLLETYLREV